MRRILSAVFVSGLAVLLCGAMPMQIRPPLSDADKADLDRVSAYLNAIHTLEGGFVQIGPEGQIDQGMFYIQKPGRMRFEYAAPSPTLIVSDGSTVAVENTKLNTTDHYPLWTTPLDLILGDDLDLKHNSEVVGVEHQEGQLVIDARSHSRRANGNITLVFAEPDLELKQWSVVDAQGLLTTVSVRDLKRDVNLDPSLFAIAQKNTFTKKEE
jgi:outer membrane lipoprotein-sorting protein